MNNTTTLAAPARRLLTGLIVTTIATASAGAWALTAAATGPTDEPAPVAAVEDATADRPAAAASDLVPAAPRPIVFAGPYPWPWITVGAATRPIVVADAYHGVGFTVCPNGTDPNVVADAYHGVGVTVCQ